MTIAVCWCRQTVCSSMSLTYNWWDRGYDILLESKTKQHDIGVFGCDCLRASSCSMQCMQKQTGACFLLGCTAAPPLPSIHMLSSWSRFLRMLHTMPFSISLHRCSFHSPNNKLMRLVLLIELHRNCLPCCMLFPCQGFVPKGCVCLHHQIFWKSNLRCLHLGLVFQNIWWTAGGIRQRQHSVHSHTVPLTRQIQPVV